MNQIQVSDEVLGREPSVWSLVIESDQVTVRELIRSRVYQEVQDYQLSQRKREQFLTKVRGHGGTGDSGSAKSRIDEPIDWKTQFEQALFAFEAREFLLLVGERQAESLDEVVESKSGTQVTFLKLIPMVGG